MSLNTLQKDSLLSEIADLNTRIKRLEAMLQGQPIGTARIADAAITNAKIDSVVADKITAGNLIVQVGVGDSEDGSIILDGVNVRQTMSDDSDTRLLIGDDGE
jgi:hypothetical protein